MGTGYMKYDFDYLRKAQARSSILLLASNFAAVCLDSSSILFCNYRNPLPIGLGFGNRNSWLVKGLSPAGMLACNNVHLVISSRATKSNGNRVLLPVT